MLKRASLILLICGALLAYEDVSFSARTLGLGGDQAALADDAFSPLVNPALPARWRRPVVGLSAMLMHANHYQGLFSYAQPVTGLGVVGGSLWYRHFANMIFEEVEDADARFFLALPAGRRLSFGASFGAHSRVYAAESGEYPLPAPRFSSGPLLSLGAYVDLPYDITAGLSAVELLKQDAPPVFQGGITWRPEMKPSSLISSALLAVNAGYGGAFKIHAGGELYLFKDVLGLRAGIRYGTDSASGFSPTVGASIRTHRLEKTDFELHYAAVFSYFSSYTSPSHQLNLAVLPGDARKAEKDSIRAAQAERARKLREQALARERDKLAAELEAIKQERSALESERADIEKLRSEALASLARTRGIAITENEEAILITISGTALQFGDDAADIPFPAGYRTLDRVAEFLFHYPNNDIVVEAHFAAPSEEEVESSEDDAEPPKYRDARALTAARARKVRVYLVEVKGMPAAAVTARGAGDSNPLIEDDPANPANTRVEIAILK